jgi:hypothetical protein
MSIDTTIERLMMLVDVYRISARSTKAEDRANLIAALRESLDMGEPVAWGEWDTQAGRTGRLMMVRPDIESGCRVPLYAQSQSAPAYVEGVRPIWETLAEIGASAPPEAWPQQKSDVKALAAENEQLRAEKLWLENENKRLLSGLGEPLAYMYRLGSGVGPHTVLTESKPEPHLRATPLFAANDARRQPERTAEERFEAWLKTPDGRLTGSEADAWAGWLAAHGINHDS